MGNGVKVDGKVALVTGANRGIGATITEALLEHGAAKVYAAVRRPESAAALVEAHGDRVVPLALDLSDPHLIQEAATSAGDVQIVVNNAGVLRQSTPLDVDAIADLEFEMSVNVYGLIRMAQAFAPVLERNGGGAFVQLNSVVSVKSFPSMATYCASKAAAYSITQALREVLGPQGTTVLSVHPGPIKTDMGKSAGLEEVAEPPSVVAEALVAALEAGEFHCFPDAMAKHIGGAYQSFSEAIVLADMSEG